MELRCEEVVPGLGCDFVAVGDTVDDTRAAMLAHGGEFHSNLMDGKTPDEAAEARAQVEGHIEQLLESRA